MGNLRQLAIALRKYHSVHDSFPPAHFRDDKGAPTHSWRVLILPNLGLGGFFDEYDFSQPWNGPNNRHLHGNWLSPLCECPNATSGPGITNYVAVVGPDTMWPGHESTRVEDLPPNTIMLVELPDSDIYWMEPRDVTLEEAVQAITANASRPKPRGHSVGTICVTVNCDIRVIDRNMDPGDLRQLFTVNQAGRR